MNSHAKFEIDLTVESFAYVARQLAQSPSVHYEQILSEAEKHRSALRMVQRDVSEKAEQAWRKQALTKAELHKLRQAAAHRIAKAQQAITRIAAQYAPHKLAA